MKKKLFIVALMVVAITALFSGSAFAKMGSTYTLWSEAATAPGAVGSPHAGYALNTKNCGVCHAVHNSPGTPTGEVLLKTTIANACTYCHITTTIGTQVYSGQADWYNTDTPYNHSSAANAACTRCHAVHGAAAAWAPASPYILRQDQGTIQGGGAFAAEGTATQLGISLFCTQCHGYYTTTNNSSSHVMTTQTATFKTHNASANYNGQVAWTASSVCQNCHTAGKAGTTQGFPHYTVNAPRFITAGRLGNAPAGMTPPNDAAWSVNNDGVCLSCHRNGVAAGVGISF